MKKIIITCSFLAFLLSCDSTPGGNKNILPKDPALNAYSHKNHDSHEKHDKQDSKEKHKDEESHESKHQSGEEHSHVDENGNYIYEIGDLTTISLNNSNVNLSVGNQSTEFKLYAFLNDNDEKVSTDKTKGWITLDRTYFKTGSADLTEKSKTQLENLSKILIEYPTANVKIGGYTDNTGDDAVNLKVSTQRAESVKNQLANLGIDSNRMAHEGYGKEHPICKANDTNDCKAQNRRVDIRVTKK